MHESIKVNANPKTLITIALVLLMAFMLIAAVPIKADDSELQIDTTAYLSISPGVVGVNQQILVNIWITPATHVQRHLSGYTVTFTRPDGTQDTIGPMDSYDGDATAWFNYAPNQNGTWKVKFTFPGEHLPAVNVSASMFGPAGTLSPAYYKPSETPEQTLIVQNDQVASWPASPLPTDYWTRPVSPENREWDIILGNYPYSGQMVNPPDKTNSYASNYGFTPYVQGPVTSHIVWKRQGALSGIMGGDFGTQLLGSGEGTYAGTPNVIYMGRCYQSIQDAGGEDILECYDLRTGEVYWKIPNPIPGGMGFFGYTPGSLTGISQTKGMEVVAGATSSLVGQSDSLLSVGSSLVKIDPWNGAVTLNVTGMSGTFYRDPFVLSVQTLNPAAGVYCLINWTTAGSSTNFTDRIISNVSWPFSSLGVCDFESNVAVSANPITPPGLQAWYGSNILAADLSTGKILWNITTPDTIYSSGTGVADHGKFAVCMMNRFWDCFDLRTGKQVWTSEKTAYPWGWAWGYTVNSAYGNIYGLSYAGVYAFDWDNGHIVWNFQAPNVPFETPYNGSSFMSTAVIADGKIYVGNGEHSPTNPLARGWKFWCINATTGAEIWNITGGTSAGAVADGYVTADDRYDGYMYVFGKGQSTTSIEAPLTALTQGQSVILTGKVLDKSPAQPGTPCVSDDSMSTQMEYLHMQVTIPLNANITGVPVSLDAVAPNGETIHIATVTSDASGTYSYLWQPPDQVGTYLVTATFAGTNSYGSSSAETALGVVQASQSTALPTVTSPLTQSSTDLYILASTIAIIVVMIIIGMLMLRKRP
jgi:outer membrane protein assembly factor BamB